MQWLTDIAGKSGKSIFSDLQELDPEMGICRLSIDYNRSFKYLASLDIEAHINKYGEEPTALLIDAPRDEESKFLHEIYGTLEELNNGRVESFFMGRRIKFRIKRGIPVIVFSNSPPKISALSPDRWSIKAIFPSTDGKDRMIQEAKVYSHVKSVAGPFVTWQDVVETVPPEALGDTPSDAILRECFLKNVEDMTNQKANLPEETEEQRKKKHNMIPGIVREWGPYLTKPKNNTPEHVQYKAQKIIIEAEKNLLKKG